MQTPGHSVRQLSCLAFTGASFCEPGVSYWQVQREVPVFGFLCPSHPAASPHLEQLPQGVICLAVVNVLDVQVAVCQLVLLVPLVLQQQAEVSMRAAHRLS